VCLGSRVVFSAQHVAFVMLGIGPSRHSLALWLQVLSAVDKEQLFGEPSFEVFTP
jgi:hypothetical protein